MNVSGALNFILINLFDVYIMIVFTRFLLQLLRADFYNPVSQFVVKATTPVLKPLRRIIPGYGGIDNASLVLMAVLAAPQVWKAWKFDPNSEEAKTYYAVPAAKKWEYAFIYLGLAAFLAVMTHDTHALLESARAVHRG